MANYLTNNHRFIKMMKYLVMKYPDGYEGFHDKAHPTGDAVAGSNEKLDAEPKESETDELTSKVELRYDTMKVRIKCSPASSHR
jgi:hypothetical protein